MKKFWSENYDGFTDSKWTREINVSNFIKTNYKEYTGDDSFLNGATDATLALWDQVLDLMKQEREAGGVLDMDTKIVGFQTDKPFKRSLQPFGGLRMSANALAQNGYKIDDEIEEIFTKYRKTHNQGVFDVYTPEMRLARKSAIITGLPDAYGRGRIIGDYRRIALYGIDRLIEDKLAQKNLEVARMDPETIQLREELSDQLRALQDLKELGKIYGYDISQPAKNAQEAIQWTYFGYLAAIKDQNGAAMSLGRTSTFIDIYIERDLEKGLLTEEEAQQLVDHFIMKLRLVKFARTPEYNQLFPGDPTWTTESIGGMSLEGKSLVTKTSFRYIHTLDNLNAAPEPNLTVLWSSKLPDGFKRYCAKMSIKTSSLQYENDDLMRYDHGDDYAIACCVSSMTVGKEMQFFGARANLAKALLYAINGGVDERLNLQVAPKFAKITSELLDYDEVMEKFDQVIDWLAKLYVDTLNVIHYMHDKYSYEALQMSLHDRDVTRFFATGIAGLSVVADSLSAIKYAQVKPIYENGLAVGFETSGEYPTYGNNIDEVDEIASDIVSTFMNKIRKHYTYRNSIPTMSILTITSNVVYGKKTGNTPDGRLKGQPFAPGANPMHQRDKNGAFASLASVAKIPFEDARDGISNTFSIIPGALGKDDKIFVGDLDIDLECADGSCAIIPNLEDGLDDDLGGIK